MPPNMIGAVSSPALMAANGVEGGGPPATQTTEAAPAAASGANGAAAAASAETPVVETPAAAAPSPAATETAAPAAPATPEPPKNEFAPTLLEEAAAKPTDAKPEEKPGEAKEAKPDGEKKPDGEAKPAEAPGETPPAPTYEFTYPEGIKPEDVSSERMTAFTSLLGEGEDRVTPAKAQKLLDLHLAEVGQVAQKLAQKQWDVFQEQQRAAKEQVLSDPELGGSRHQTAIREIMSFIEQFGGTAEERKQLFDDFRATGIANRVSLLRMLRRAGVALAREGAPHSAPPPRSPAPTRQQRQLARYEKTTPAAAG